MIPRTSFHYAFSFDRADTDGLVGLDNLKSIVSEWNRTSGTKKRVVLRARLGKNSPYAYLYRNKRGWNNPYSYIKLDHGSRYDVYVYNRY